MRKVLILKHDNGALTRIVRPTHIGRSEHLHWYGDPADVPPQFHTLEDVIRVHSGRASRNHCAIYLKDNRYRILDLNSAHGTVVNNTPLQPGEERILHHNDTLVIGDCSLSVELYPRDCAYFMVDPADSTDIGKLSDDLSTGGMDTIHRTFRTMPKGEFMKILRDASVDASPHSTFIVYITGDGCCPVLAGERFLPTELYSTLGATDGFKHVIADRCAVEPFVNTQLPPNTVVTAATSSASSVLRALLKGYFRTISNPDVQGLKKNIDAIGDPGICGKYQAPDSSHTVLLPIDHGRPE